MCSLLEVFLCVMTQGLRHAGEYRRLGLRCQPSSRARARDRARAVRFPFRSYSSEASPRAASESSRRPARASTSARSTSASARVPSRSVGSTSPTASRASASAGSRLSPPRQDLRPRRPPEHLREHVVGTGGLLALAAEALRLVELPLGEERVGEEAGDAREVGALAAFVERREAVAQRLGRRTRRARELLDEIGLLRVERGPQGEAGFLDRPSPLGQELPRRVDVASHRLEHGALDGARCADRRVVALEGEKLAAALDALFDGQRPEDRAHHQPRDALGELGPIAATARERERLPPRFLGGSQRALHGSRDAADEVPGLREAVVVAQLLAGRERLLRELRSAVRRSR